MIQLHCDAFNGNFDILKSQKKSICEVSSNFFYIVIVILTLLATHFFIYFKIEGQRPCLVLFFIYTYIIIYMWLLPSSSSSILLLLLTRLTIVLHATVFIIIMKILMHTLKFTLSSHSCVPSYVCYFMLVYFLHHALLSTVTMITTK